MYSSRNVMVKVVKRQSADHIVLKARVYRNKTVKEL